MSAITKAIRTVVLVALAAVAAAPAARAGQPGKSPVKVFLLAGQSNMEGMGTVEGDRKGTLRSLLKDPNTAGRYKHLVGKDGKWIVRDDVWIWCLPGKKGDRKGNLTVGYGAKSRFIGPEFGFGLAVGEHLDNQVLLIKVAWGGRSLAKDFRPPSSGGEVGGAYSALLKHAKEVLRNLRTHFPDYDGDGYEIAGFGWHHGWNDGCGWRDTREYEKNLANFIRDVRKEFGVGDVPFVIANSGFAGWKQKVDRRLAIMKAQAAVAKYDEFKGNVVCVETRDFFRPYPSRHNYHWNFNGETLYLVGEAMGRAMVKLLGAAAAAREAAEKSAGPPDLTRGATLDAKQAKRTWNLGPTGARGWIWWGKDMTAASRQILITQVEEGSPAHGVLQAGDVILGAGGKRFTEDARKSLGHAITEAEKEENKGVLKLTRWREGTAGPVKLRLKVMGAYSDTAPYDCPKSRKVLEQGCRHIAERRQWGRFSVGALALLASGKAEHVDRVRQFVHKTVDPAKTSDIRLETSRGMVAWRFGYQNVFLAEYYLATGDRHVLPVLRQSAITLARGQGGAGTWGHGLVQPNADGQLHGPVPPYGPVNAAGLVCWLSLVLARKCGIEHPEVQAAIQRSNRFFSYYVGKGTIPYGEHRPGLRGHDDNGKNSIAALAFALQGRRRGARFFSRMVTASHEDREFGHTGNFFSYLWGALGANCGGPKAARAFLKEQRWYYDLARRWDGGFAYQPAGGGSGGGYYGFSTTAAYVLAYALPLRKLFITGREPREENRLSDEEVAEAIETGRWRAGAYDRKSTEELLRCLGSWSPWARGLAAAALAKRRVDLVPRLTRMQEGDNPNAWIGASQALASMGPRAARAVPTLVRQLSHPDNWIRARAAYALMRIGKPARPAVPAMLKAAARADESDPREETQNALAFALFYPGGALRFKGLLADSLEHVDRRLLYPAIRKIIRNPDGRARGCMRSVYRHLTLDDVTTLAPDILYSIETEAPRNTMFNNGVRLAGLQLLARHRIKEGIPLCLKILTWPGWGKAYRVKVSLEVLKQYGGAAKSVLPQLKDLATEQMRGSKQLQEVITAIEKDSDPPRLVNLRDLLKDKSKE